MLEVAISAEVGDEQYNEDPTTQKLEAKVAEMLGKSCAMFMPTATMANEIAIKVWCKPGEELIAASECHLYFAEAGGPSVLAQVMIKAIPTQTGVFSGEEVKKQIRTMVGPHFPKPSLVNIENTTNMGGGVAWTKSQLDSVTKVTKELGLKTHIDGSRLFNAAVKTKLTPKQICENIDSVTICLSKGLSCPMGAVLAFPKEFYPEVRKYKQLLGGAMRQSGYFSAMGLFALENNISKLEEDHQKASEFYSILGKLSDIELETAPETNMVFFHYRSNKKSPEEFHKLCLENGLRFSKVGASRFRAVFHRDVSLDSVQKIEKIMKSVI
jgi:threonine aldolase